MNLIVSESATAAQWAANIRFCWNATFVAVIETGRLIARAKDVLEHGQFEAMIASELPFGPRTAQMLMAIANDTRLTNPNHASLLPPSWTTLYELHKLPDPVFAEKLADGTIRPDIERGEVASIRKGIRTAPAKAEYEARVDAGCTLADLQALADSGAKFGSIEADPNWQYETWSAKGKDRSPEQHYKTDVLAPIKALPVKQLAAKDAVLHLWCLDCMIPQALDVIEEWGFKFIKIGFHWVKLNPSGVGLFMGMGHWTRDGAEICLFATKGNPKRRDAGVRQVIEAPVGRHSEKPKEMHRRVEALTDGPYLELFARELRDNATCWGDEIPRDKFVIPEIIQPEASAPPLPEPAEASIEPASVECAPAPMSLAGSTSSVSVIDPEPFDPNDPEGTGIPIFCRRVTVASPREAQSVNAETSG